ncbi:MAG: hypothetical protein M1445_16335, partial [Bacteroidetes bacterium]|nr:hypothetical protein [Bacteroidota bacterium]
CILHSDIVLSELAATEGIQRTLDYIPGNVFLGLVAGKIYNDIEPQHAMDLFHNANVRFGDAFPLIGSKRSIKVPASWYVKKGETIKDQVYIYLQMSEKEPMVQLRDKFIIKESDTQFSEIKLGKSFAIKSAYDSGTRRSKDQQMYGYQSLEAGMELCFQVDLVGFSVEETSKVEKIIKESLTGKCTIGRSKTAQYGQVEIVPVKDEDIEPGFRENGLTESEHTFIYAESRLLFIDDYGQPIIPIEGKYYGINGAKIDLERSQIRTFRYAPYNFKRQSRDADRFGIEKGSVICINRKTTSAEQTLIKQGIGLFKNEGFGKVLINPEFLVCNVNGEAKFTYLEENKDHSQANSKSTLDENLTFKKESDSKVWQYLIQQQTNKSNQQSVYVAVNKFVSDNQKRFEKEVFASQWGTIRTIAMRSKNQEDLKNRLYKSSNGYLVHGVAKDKWDEMGRLDLLKSFIEKLEPLVASEAVVNLAAEMAKKCRRK